MALNKDQDHSTPADDGRDDVVAQAHLALDRAQRLREQVIDFATTPRFADSLATAVLAVQEENEEGDLQLGEAQMVDAVVEFAFTHRLPNGMSISERYLRGRDDIPDVDRAMLESWREALDGIFEILETGRESLVTRNLIDGMTYQIYGFTASELRDLPAGGFLQAIIAPLTPVDGWFVVGSMMIGNRAEAQSFAAQALLNTVANPAAALRDPARRAEARKALLRERAVFMETAGSDEWCGPEPEASKLMRVFQMNLRDSRATAFRSRGFVSQFPEDIGELPEPEFPGYLRGATTIGIIYDDVTGFNYYPDLDRVQAIFDDPQRLAGPEGPADKALIERYLRSEDIPPTVFERLAAAYPQTVDAVFQAVLDKPAFTWAADGAKLLRTRKPWFYRTEPTPGVPAFSDRVLELLGYIHKP